MVLSASTSISRAYSGDPSVTCSSVMLMMPTINGGVITRSRCSGSMMRAPGRNCLQLMLTESWAQMSLLRKERNSRMLQAPLSIISGIHTYFQAATLWLFTFLRNSRMYMNKSILVESLSSMYSPAFMMNSLYLEFSVGSTLSSPLYTADLMMYNLLGGSGLSRKQLTCLTALSLVSMGREVVWKLKGRLKPQLSSQKKTRLSSTPLSLTQRITSLPWLISRMFSSIRLRYSDNFSSSILIFFFCSITTSTSSSFSFANYFTFPLSDSASSGVRQVRNSSAIMMAQETSSSGASTSLRSSLKTTMSASLISTPEQTEKMLRKVFLLTPPNTTSHFWLNWRFSTYFLSKVLPSTFFWNTLPYLSNHLLKPVLCANCISSSSLYWQQNSISSQGSLRKMQLLTLNRKSLKSSLLQLPAWTITNLRMSLRLRSWYAKAIPTSLFSKCPRIRQNVSSPISFRNNSSLLCSWISNCSSGSREKCPARYSSSSASGIASRLISNLLEACVCFMFVFFMVIGSIWLKLGSFLPSMSKWTCVGFFTSSSRCAFFWEALSAFFFLSSSSSEVLKSIFFLTGLLLSSSESFCSSEYFFSIIFLAGTFCFFLFFSTSYESGSDSDSLTCARFFFFLRFSFLLSSSESESFLFFFFFFFSKTSSSFFAFSLRMIFTSYYSSLASLFGCKSQNPQSSSAGLVGG